jgi:hypothetical protein
MYLTVKADIVPKIGTLPGLLAYSIDVSNLRPSFFPLFLFYIAIVSPTKDIPISEE